MIADIFYGKANPVCVFLKFFVIVSSTKTLHSVTTSAVSLYYSNIKKNESWLANETSQALPLNDKNIENRKEKRTM